MLLWDVSIHNPSDTDGSPIAWLVGFEFYTSLHFLEIDDGLFKGKPGHSRSRAAFVEQPRGTRGLFLILF